MSKLIKLPQYINNIIWRSHIINTHKALTYVPHAALIIRNHCFNLIQTII
jgi:hypothetical protein